MKRFLVFLFLTPIIVACSPPADDAPEEYSALIPLLKAVVSTQSTSAKPH